jgi:Protein of unknown function (DUF2934)
MAQTPASTKPSQAEQNELDDALDDTFPASDPLSLTDPTHGMSSNRSTPDEQAIRERAYEIWQKAGALYGSHEEHWTQARSELERGAF